LQKRKVFAAVIEQDDSGDKADDAP
jgi:hypothetical protein